MNSDTHPSPLPEHLPIDMAYAPNQKPFSKRPTNAQQASNINEQQHNALAQHSLSPEKLGVVGYVKDVAGFVKDVVRDRRNRNGRRNSESSISSTTATDNNDMATMTNEPNTSAGGNRPRRSSVGEHNIGQQQQQRQRAEGASSPFAEAITGLFPGMVSNHANNEQLKGCIHADELRSQVMQMNEQNQTTGREEVELIHK